MLTPHVAAWSAVAVWALAPFSAQAQRPTARTITLDGLQVRVHAAGLERRRPGTPVVVFEAGAGNSLEVWSSVLPRVAEFAPVVAYDRAGLGQSAWDGTTSTPRSVSTRLFRILREVGVDPPFVLVGYSWGGMLVRYAATHQPRGVAGLVLVDPGPMLTLSRSERLAPFDSIGAGRAGYNAYWEVLGKLFNDAPAPVRAEFNMVRGYMAIDATALEPLNPITVPAVVLMAAKYMPLPPGAAFPFDGRAHFEVELRQRMRVMHSWLASSPMGTLVLSNHTDHAIPRDDPELIVWAVRRILAVRD